MSDAPKVSTSHSATTTYYQTTVPVADLLARLEEMARTFMSPVVRVDTYKGDQRDPGSVTFTVSEGRR